MLLCCIIETTLQILQVVASGCCYTVVGLGHTDGDTFAEVFTAFSLHCMESPCIAIYCIELLIWQRRGCWVQRHRLKLEELVSKQGE